MSYEIVCGLGQKTGTLKNIYLCKNSFLQLSTYLANSISGFSGSSLGDPSGEPLRASVCPPENAVSEPISSKILKSYLLYIKPN